MNEKRGFTLTDGEEMNRANPISFWMPDRKERENVIPGDSVKVIITWAGDYGGFASNGFEGGLTERMWCLVVEAADSNGVIAVKLDNVPLDGGASLEVDSPLAIKAEHIIEIGDNFAKAEGSEATE